MSVESNNTPASSVELNRESFTLKPFEATKPLEDRTLYTIGDALQENATLDQVVPSNVSHIALYDPETKKTIALKRAMSGSTYLSTFETWQGGAAPELKKGLILSKLAAVAETQAMISNDTRSALSGLAEQVGLGESTNKAFSFIDKIKNIVTSIMSMLGRHFPVTVDSTSAQTAKGTAEEELAIFESYVEKFPPSAETATQSPDDKKALEEKETKLVTTMHNQLKTKGLAKAFPKGIPEALQDKTLQERAAPTKEEIARARTHLYTSVFTKDGKELPLTEVIKLLEKNAPDQEAYATWMKSNSTT